ncbi:uncharacterized protein [Physcomitrium patens]|uniref:Uncharacterized protein n=1 Tax=Physcomitrium patens TaxID=3218 RepID=A0A7I4BJ96_PHYPA|nr:uncharacterized protein LOC112294936 [Physcomitrium patens]|eukprot:XP_024401717.1 uncharacterized protein LOC112294936 [Physcomitrella patens]
MAIASEARTALQLPETDQLEGNSDLKEVIIDSLAERDPDGQEPLQEGVLRPLRAFDYVELPPGVAVSTPCSSEGGLQRLWEGGLFDVREYADVTLHTACCPWHTFGTNMERSGFGTSWVQGGFFLLLLIGALCFYVTFLCTGSPWYIYGTVSLFLVIAMYAGHYRARIRRRFNIIGSEGDDTVSTIDDHLNHLMCGCCSLCQEARTLKHNNVHNGVWHGRGDILVIGSQVVFSPNGLADPALNRPRRYPSWRKTCKVELPTEPVFLDTGVDHAWTGEVPQIQHLPLISR